MRPKFSGMSINPRISVIIPHYNQEAYLQQALASVAAQTFRPLEIIVVDDASERPPRLPSFPDEMPVPLRLIRKEQNEGVAVARNMGIRAARGDYIALLDADDLWMPWHLEAFVRCVDRHPEVDFYAAPAVLFRRKAKEIPVPATHSCACADYFRLASAHAWTVNSSNVIMSRRLIGSIGGFDEKLQVFEDIDFWIRAGRLFPLCTSRSVSVAVRLDTPGSLSKNRRLYREELLRYFFDKHLNNHPQGHEKRFIHQNILGSLLMYKYHGQKPPAFLKQYLDTRTLNFGERFKLALPSPLFHLFRKAKRSFY